MKLNELQREMDGGKNQIYPSPITDKDRLDWLQSGHGVIALSKPSKKTVFTANFEEQDWDEHEDVRKAIDIAMKRNHKCPKCGSHTQVWVNQNTKGLTCHRWGCNNVELE